MRIKFYRLHLLKVCMVALFALLGTGLLAQSLSSGNQTVRVTGTVTDAHKLPVVGATIIEKGTSNGVSTNINGEYVINVNPNATLQVQHLSYTISEMAVNNRTMVNLVVQEKDEQIDEMVVVGYGVQKKTTITGAVSAIKGADIVTTKNENVQNMLTGKVAGLRVVQNSSEPGQFKGSMDIRGFGTPTVVIDGVVRDNIQRLDAEDIESISVLKDASAAIYGLKAGNGVILVTTKKGNKGQSQISYNGSMTWQKPSNFPEMVDAADWMTLYNEKQMHSVMYNPSVKYSDADIASWRDGTNKSTDWRKEVFRNTAPQMQHTINATGGNDVVTYYTSIGYQNQGSFLRTDAINYEKFTLRGNISANINKNLKFDLNLSGFIDDRKQTPNGSYDIVRATWIMRPMDAVWYDKDKEMYMEPENNTIINPVAAMNAGVSGENSYKSKWFQSSAALTYTIPQVKGLSVKAFYSFDAIINDNKEFQKSYDVYDPDYATNGNKTTWLKNKEKPYQISRFYYIKNHSMWNLSANYNNTFDKVHNVSALLLFENTFKEGDNFRGTRQGMLPVSEVFAGDPDNQTFEQDSGAGALYEYAYQSVVSRLAYDYANKYMVEGTLRHEASSKFSKEMQWVTFPSVLAAYRISQEKFWKDSPLSFINNFKIRGSYGVLGNDGNMTYQWTTGYNYPSSGGGISTAPKGYLFYDGTTQKYIASSNDRGIPNKNLTWTEQRITNIGFDAEAWHGLLGVTVEYFNRKNEGEAATRVGSLPGIAGVSLPAENLNSSRNRGFEIELSHRNRVGEVRYEVRGNFAYTKQRQLYYEQAAQGNSYLNWRTNVNDRDTGIWWGYGTAGRVTNWNQIYYNPTFISNNTIMGDYLYEDWNGDGQINDLDLHPLENNSTTPLINYGLTISAQYKGLDISMLWQGTSSRYTSYQELLLSPLNWGNAGTLSQFMDRWHPVDPKASPYNPATEWVSGYYGYTGSTPNTSSKFNMQNASYLRLKSLEIGYTLPRKWLKDINISNVRVFVSGYNLLTFTALDFVDPEFPSSDFGYNYPLNKTFTAGINVKF